MKKHNFEKEKVLQSKAGASRTNTPQLHQEDLTY